MDLYVLADGLHVMRYAEIRGMRPRYVFWRNNTLREQMTFISDDAALLVMIQGCTSTKVDDITAAVRMVQKEDVFKEICVYSNIELPDLSIPYYLYNGDIFDGTEELTYRGQTQGNLKSNRKDKANGLSQHYINKFLDDPYLSDYTEVISAPYNAADENTYVGAYDTAHMFVFNNAANKVGIVGERLHKKQVAEFGIPAEEVYNPNKDTAVVNMLGYNGGLDTSVSLMTEIAAVQWYKQGFTGEYKPTVVSDECLFTAFLLSTAICYVEIFRDGIVDKFLATRNVDLLMQLSTALRADKEPFMRINKDLGTPQVRNGYKQYLALSSSQIQTGVLPYLKLDVPTKRTKTYNLIMPRGANAQIRTRTQYRIIPAFTLIAQNMFLWNLLQNNVVTFDYLKDNMQVRTLTTTMNRDVLINALGGDTVTTDKIIKAYADDSYLVGMHKVPDLDLVGSDSYMRVLNQRICKMSVCPVNQYKRKSQLADITVLPDVVKGYLEANKANTNYLQNMRFLLEYTARLSWFKQANLEAKHYSDMSKCSKYAQAHAQMVNYITQEINEKVTTIKESVAHNLSGMSAEKLYVDILAIISEGAQQRTTEFCKQLYEMIQMAGYMFPDYERVMAANMQSVAIV